MRRMATKKKTTTQAAAELEVLADHGRAINGLSCAPGGRFLTATMGSMYGPTAGTKQVRLWNTKGKELGSFGTGTGCVCWYAEMSPDGDTVAAGFGNLTLGFWRMKKDSTEFIPTPGGIIASLGFSADGQRLFTGNCGDNTVRTWDVAKRTELAAGKTKKSGTWFVALSPDGKRGASGSADKLVHLWDAAKCTELEPLAGHTGKILCLRFSPDGRTLASASQDKTVRLWNLKSGTSRVCEGHRKQVTAVAFFPKGDRVASTAGDGTVRVWSAKDGRELACIALGDTKADAVAVTDAGDVLAGCQDGKVRRVLRG